MSLTERYDAVVVGGGPAGSAAGSKLAAAGLKVAILEKEKFPRFSIGESLLPHGNSLLKELGVWKRVESSGFMRKYGAEFCTADKSRLRRFWFGQNLGPALEYTYQVERAKFDELLLDNARESGCQVMEETKVIGVENPDTATMEVLCEGPSGPFKIETGWIVDASGRSAFAGQFLRIPRKRPQKNRRIAIYGHFENVLRNGGKAEGHITIARIKGGWFWLIPLANNKTSVGLVIPSSELRDHGKKDLEEIFAQALQAAPEVADRMRHSNQLGQLKATGDYSWKFPTFAKRRIILTGDAAGFIDPIFSSGVMIALKSGIQAAALISRAKKEGRGLSRWDRFIYTFQVSRWMHQYAQIIKVFYDRAGFEVFMNPSPFLQIPLSIARLVGGETKLNSFDKLRLLAFQWICRFQKIIPIAPSIPSLR